MSELEIHALEIHELDTHGAINNLDDMVQMVLDTAERIIPEEEHVPVMMAIGPEGTLFTMDLSFFFENRESMNHLEPVMQQVIDEFGFRSIILVSETWTSQDMELGHPSADSERQEALLIQAEGKPDRRFFVMVPIENNAGSRVLKLEEKEVSTVTMSRFDFLGTRKKGLDA